MYDFFLFYWSIWIIFIVVYFFMPLSTKRDFLLIWILSIISTVGIYVPVVGIQFSLGFFIILLGAVVYFLEGAVNTKKLFHSFAIMIGYGGLLIWRQLAPIWFFLPDYMMLPILMIILIRLLERDIKKALPILILAMSFGQSIFQMILITYYLTDKMGNLHLLTHINVIVLLMIGLYAIQLIIHYISMIVHRKLI